MTTFYIYQSFNHTTMPIAQSHIYSTCKNIINRNRRQMLRILLIFAMQVSNQLLKPRMQQNEVGIFHFSVKRIKEAFCYGF